MCIYKSSDRFESYRCYKRVIQYGSQSILFSGFNQLITRFYYIHLKETSFNG